MSSATDKVKELEAQLKEVQKGQLFVTYYSPGTLFLEQSAFEVETRDLAACAARAKVDVKERYGAKPFAFRFTDGNGKSLSGLHYLTGKVIRYDDVPDDKEHSIMRSNMFNNEGCVVVENTNSFKHVSHFSEEDVIVDWDGNVTQRGNDPDLVVYRAEMKKRYDEKYGQ
jgi:hypothetical protein